MTASSSLFRVSRNRREWRARRSGAGVLARQANRQDLAALFATAGQDFTSPLGGHARAKAVRANTALVPGTICGLTHLELQFQNAFRGTAKELEKVTVCTAWW